MIEYRVCWSAMSNVTFRGHGDWEPWDWEEDGDEGMSPEDFLSQNQLDGKEYNVPYDMEMALDLSGFEYWIETREV